MTTDYNYYIQRLEQSLTDIPGECPGLNRRFLSDLALVLRKCKDEIAEAHANGVMDGRATQAKLELAGRDKFMRELRSNAELSAPRGATRTPG